MDTPEFLAWAIEYTCPIRGFQNGCDPERTERHLRSARAVSDALEEGRVFEGLCVDPPNGFRMDDALEIYGGMTAVRRHCLACPANARPAGFAGCFGMLPVLEGFHESVESFFDRIAGKYEGLFFPTNPRWYGLWTQALLGRAQHACLLELFESPEMAAMDRRETAELRAGLQIAMARELPIHVTLFPPGSVEGPWWRLAVHCPRCKAVWSVTKARECAVCGYVGHPAPEKKRHVRGMRPYVPLASLLGEEEAGRFLIKYGAFRKQRESKDRAENRLPAGQPDNLPAGSDSAGLSVPGLPT